MMYLLYLLKELLLHLIRFSVSLITEVTQTIKGNNNCSGLLKYIDIWVITVTKTFCRILHQYFRVLL